MGKFVDMKSEFVLFTYDLPSADNWYSTYEIGIRLDYGKKEEIIKKLNIINTQSKKNWNASEIDSKADLILTKINLIKNDLEKMLPEIPLTYYTLNEYQNDIITVRLKKAQKRKAEEEEEEEEEQEVEVPKIFKSNKSKDDTIRYFNDLARSSEAEIKKGMAKKGQNLWEDFVDLLIKEPILWNVVVNGETVYDYDELVWIIDELNDVVRNCEPRKSSLKTIKDITQLSWLVSFNALFQKDKIHNPKYEMDSLKTKEFVGMANAFNSGRGNFTSKLNQSFKQFSQKSVYLLPTEIALAPNKTIKDAEGNLKWVYDKNMPDVKFKYKFNEDGATSLERHEFTWDKQRMVSITENGVTKELFRDIEQRDPRVEVVKKSGEPTIEEIVWSELYPLYYLALKEMLIDPKTKKFKARFRRFTNKFAYNIESDDIEPDFDRWVKWIRVVPSDEQATMQFNKLLSSMVEETDKKTTALEDLLEELQGSLQAIEGVYENNVMIKPPTTIGIKKINSTRRSIRVKYYELIKFYPKAQAILDNNEEILKMIQKINDNRLIIHPDQLTKFKIDLPNNDRNIENFVSICGLEGWYFTFPNEWGIDPKQINLISELKERDDTKETRLNIEAILHKMDQYALGEIPLPKV